MNLEVQSVPGGITCRLISVETGVTCCFIPEQVISGICKVLVNGRDAEDALAPIYCIEGIIESYLGTHTWQMPTTPEDSWIGDLASEPNAVAEYDLTPLVVALGQLDYLGGGETDRVVLFSA